MFRRVLLWGLVCAVAAAGEAQRLRILEPAAGAVLAPGDAVVVRWEGSAEGSREMELLLSLDGGTSYAVRLSRELLPGSRAFTWRVPALPSADARLAIRAELFGRETVVATGPSFVIASPEAPTPLPAIRHRAGEIWSVHAAGAAGAGPAAAPTLAPGSSHRATAAGDASLAALDPRAPQPTLVRRAAVGPGRAQDQDFTAPPSPGPRPAGSAATPLRI